ncbi:hypothetical protein ABT169_25905 [Streptomyces sp. NPDC001616]|uniref:hypothetical protein n=1 Tax=Streptomyces sp. NPDC001616 TaxID=3156648 RepID=UPI00332DE233
MSTTAPPMAATITSALTAAGVGAFWEPEDGMLIAHPLTTNPDNALNSEHILVEWSGAVPNASAGERATLEATVWAPDGTPDFTQLATAYSTPDGRPLGEEAAQCARAVAEWFAEPRLTAGGMLLAALAEYGITTYDEHLGMSYAVPVDQEAAPGHIHSSFHLSLGDREPMVAHVPSAHTGWTIFVHDDQGEPIGDPLYFAGDGGLVDCAKDSATAAAVIADYITAPDRHCDCYSQERYGRQHDYECNRYRRP